MQLTPERAYSLLFTFGIFAREACDKCGQVLGAVRFTRKDLKGEWCSRKCRDGTDAREPRTCRHCKGKLPETKRRGAVFCDDACRKALQRQNGTPQMSATPKLSRTKPSIYAAFLSGKEAAGISGHSATLGGVGR